jgi:DNA-binding LytR/AlgR family response regulator
VDDEPLALEVLKKYINAVPHLELAGTCTDAIEASAFLQNQSVDLLFLDIQMPQLLGTELMRTLSKPPKVIFTTAFRKFAIEGFELEAVDYLLKPISFERFLKAVNKVISPNANIPEAQTIAEAKNGFNTDTFLCLRADRKNIKVNLDDIIFIESIKDYVKVVTKDRTIISKQSISSLEEMLPASAFIRTHRSFIVSIKKIESFTQDLIQLGKYELPISRSYRHEVEKALGS